MYVYIYTYIHVYIYTYMYMHIYGRDRGAVAEAEFAADGLDARLGVQAVWDPLPLAVRPHRRLRLKFVKFLGLQPRVKSLRSSYTGLY